MFGLFMQQPRLRPVRRLPIAFGWLTKRGDAATARWIRPVLTQAGIRRDTVRVLRSMQAAAGHGTGAGGLGQRGPGDAAEHGARLAALLPGGQLAEGTDSYTLIPLDQPARFALLIREFVRS